MLEVFRCCSILGVEIYVPTWEETSDVQGEASPSVAGLGWAGPLMASPDGFLQSPSIDERGCLRETCCWVLVLPGTSSSLQPNPPRELPLPQDSQSHASSPKTPAQTPPCSKEPCLPLPSTTFCGVVSCHCQNPCCLVQSWGCYLKHFPWPPLLWCQDERLSIPLLVPSLSGPPWVHCPEAD